MMKFLILFGLLLYCTQSFSQTSCDSLRSLIFVDDTINGSSKRDVISYFPDISKCLKLDDFEDKLFFGENSMYSLFMVYLSNQDTIYVDEIFSNIKSKRSSKEYQGYLGLIKFKAEYCNKELDNDSWLVLQTALQNLGTSVSELDELKQHLFSDKNSGKTYCEIIGPGI